RNRRYPRTRAEPLWLVAVRGRTLRCTRGGHVRQWPSGLERFATGRRAARAEVEIRAMRRLTVLALSMLLAACASQAINPAPAAASNADNNRIEFPASVPQ